MSLPRHPHPDRGLALPTCVGLMGLLSAGLLTLSLLAKQDVRRTRQVTDGAQLRQVLLAVAQRADALVRAGDNLPADWELPAGIDVSVVVVWREQTPDHKVLAIEAVRPRALARQVLTWERDEAGWQVTQTVLERGS